MCLPHWLHACIHVCTEVAIYLYLWAFCPSFLPFMLSHHVAENLTAIDKSEFNKCHTSTRCRDFGIFCEELDTGYGLANNKDNLQLFASSLELSTAF